MKMKFLRVVRKRFGLIGFSPKLKLLNHMTLSILGVGFFGVGLQWIFLFYEANSSQEYMESTYFAISFSCVVLSAANTIFTRQKLFAFFKSADALFNEST